MDRIFPLPLSFHTSVVWVFSRSLIPYNPLLITILVQTQNWVTRCQLLTRSFCKSAFNYNSGLSEASGDTEYPIREHHYVDIF